VRSAASRVALQPGGLPAWAQAAVGLAVRVRVAPAVRVWAQLEAALAVGSVVSRS